MNNKEECSFETQLFYTEGIRYYKWLSFETSEEKEIVNYFNSSLSKNLSINDLEELIQYRKQRMYVNLFKKCIYDDKIITDEEYDLMTSFMNKYTLDDIIKHKISDEKICALESTSKELFSKMSNQDCMQYLRQVDPRFQTDKYLSMSLEDSLIYHFISKFYTNRCVELVLDVNSQIMKDTQKRCKKRNLTRKI